MNQLTKKLLASITMLLMSTVVILVFNAQKLNTLQASLVDTSKLRGSLFTAEIEDEVIRRFLLYNVSIEENFLEDGMVVDRDRDGRALNKCDSLLFSSLRFVALSKLGLYTEADAAWQAIEKSQYKGRWQRHPNCDHRLSRDMILGVLAALTQRPPRAREHLIKLMRHLDANQGFAGDGPVHVSYVTPGVAELIRQLAHVYGVPESEFPANVRYSFSTLEFSSLGSRRGYRSHLNALILWIELEIAVLQKNAGIAPQRPRSVVHMVDRFLNRVTWFELATYRPQWAAEQLVLENQSNLFFIWLRHRAAGGPNDSMRMQLLRQLATMPEFPKDRTPSNCDRAADYLWQRDFREYKPLVVEDCYKFFHGVDFLWMTALLLSPEDGLNSASSDKLAH